MVCNHHFISCLAASTSWNFTRIIWCIKHLEHFCEYLHSISNYGTIKFQLLESIFNQLKRSFISGLLGVGFTVMLKELILCYFSISTCNVMLTELKCYIVSYIYIKTESYICEYLLYPGCCIISCI